MRNQRKKLTKLFNQQAGICPYCMEDMTLEKGFISTATLDHIIPKMRGGKDLNNNLLAACSQCNHKKGSKSLALFLIEKGLK